jgi:hypothetical protein
VRIEAEGPFGRIEPIEYVIIVSDLKDSHATAAGNLHAVALQLKEISNATNQLNSSIGGCSPPRRESPWSRQLTWSGPSNGLYQWNRYPEVRRGPLLTSGPLAMNGIEQ